VEEQGLSEKERRQLLEALQTNRKNKGKRA
jgi:hypothetical protein